MSRPLLTRTLSGAMLALSLGARAPRHRLAARVRFRRTPTVRRGSQRSKVLGPHRPGTTMTTAWKKMSTSCL